MAWIELDELRALLGLAADDPTDEALTTVLAGAEAAFERLSGVPVAAAERNVSLDSSGSETLYLPHRPVIGEVTLYRTAYGAAEEEVDADTYVLDRAAGMLHKRIRGLRWASGRAAYRAEFQSGHDPIPSDVVSAVVEMVGMILHAAESAGLTSETIGSYSWRSDGARGGEGGGFSPTTQATLERWRRVPMPPLPA